MRWISLEISRHVSSLVVFCCCCLKKKQQPKKTCQTLFRQLTGEPHMVADMVHIRVLVLFYVDMYSVNTRGELCFYSERQCLL